jgi:hypothetical protein
MDPIVPSYRLIHRKLGIKCYLLSDCKDQSNEATLSAWLSAHHACSKIVFLRREFQIDETSELKKLPEWSGKLSKRNQWSNVDTAVLSAETGLQSRSSVRSVGNSVQSALQVKSERPIDVVTIPKVWDIMVPPDIATFKKQVRDD